MSAKRKYEVNQIIRIEEIPPRTGEGRKSAVEAEGNFIEAKSFMEEATRKAPTPGEAMVVEVDRSLGVAKKLKNPLMSYLIELRKYQRQFSLKGKVDIIVRGTKAANEKQARFGRIYLVGPVTQ